MSYFRFINRHPNEGHRDCYGPFWCQPKNTRLEGIGQTRIAIPCGVGSINIWIIFFSVVACLLIELTLPISQLQAWGQSPSSFGLPIPANQSPSNQYFEGTISASNRNHSVLPKYYSRGDFATERPDVPDQSRTTPQQDSSDYRSMSPNSWETWGPSSPTGNGIPQVNFPRGNSAAEPTPYFNVSSLDRNHFFQPDSNVPANNGASQFDASPYPSGQSNSNLTPTGSNRSASPNSPFLSASHVGGQILSTPPAGRNQVREVPPMPNDIRQDLELPQRSATSERVPDFPPLEDSPSSSDRSILEGIEAEIAKPSIPSNPQNSAYSDSLTRALLKRSEQKQSNQWNLQPPLSSYPMEGTAIGQSPHANPSMNRAGSAPIFMQPDNRVNAQPGVQTAPQVPMSTWGSIEPNFRPNLGHRSAFPVQRTSDADDYGQRFEFEEKKEDFPGIKEILVTGRYFGSASLLFLKPVFQGNTAVTRELSGLSESFQFGYDEVPRFQIGFESKFGPGVELDYWTLNDTSRVTTFLSDGVETGTLSVFLTGSDRVSRLTAGNPGERLNARHSLRIDSMGASFFKEVPLKRSRINGKFGVHAIRLTQETRGDLFNNAGLQIESLFARSDLRAFGPQFNLEYFRPVGHTPIEFLTSVGGSLMFGKRTNFATNTAGDSFARFNAREFIATTDFFTGGQYRRLVAENRYWFLRFGFNYQIWIDGGSAVSTGDNFGLRGFTLTAGYNR